MLLDSFELSSHSVLIEMTKSLEEPLQRIFDEDSGKDVWNETDIIVMSSQIAEIIDVKGYDTE